MLLAGIVGVSTAVPAAVVAPVAEQWGWRFSLGMWSATSIVPLVPWIVVIARERRGRLPDDVAGSTPTEAGVLLAVTGLISVPGALVVPLLVARLRNVGRLIAVGVAQGIAYALGPLLVGLLRDVSGGGPCRCCSCSP